MRAYRDTPHTRQSHPAKSWGYQSVSIGLESKLGHTQKRSVPSYTVAEEGVRLKDIAAVIGRGLNVHVISISQEQAQEHFGFLGFFAGRDPLTSSVQTRAKLGWNPTGPSLLTDLGNMRYSQV